MKLGDDWTLVAGIDPGTKRIGLCILGVKGQELQPVDFRDLRVTGATLDARIHSISGLLREHLIPVKLIAVEDGYVGDNERTSLVTAMARGVCVDVAHEFSRHVRRAQPSEARQSLGMLGAGNSQRAAVKQRVIRAIRLILNVPGGRRLTDNEADAATLAVWGSNRLWSLDRTDIPDVRGGLA